HSFEGGRDSEPSDTSVPTETSRREGVPPIHRRLSADDASSFAYREGGSRGGAALSEPRGPRAPLGTTSSATGEVAPAPPDPDHAGALGLPADLDSHFGPAPSPEPPVVAPPARRPTASPRAMPIPRPKASPYLEDRLTGAQKGLLAARRDAEE